jgi:aryl-alcohol dehydrogenase-like predicted oxidoreductase
MTPLPYRHVPGLGGEVSAVGAGCWPLGGPAHNNGKPVGWAPVDDQQAQQTLRAAYDAGITVYDTADVYGRSERHLGAFLAAVPREAVTVISKVGYTSRDGRHPYHPQVMRRQLTTTLTNLRTSYLDVYAFHSGDFGPEDTYLDDAAATMRQFVNEGLVLAVGMRAPHEFAVEWAAHPHTRRGQQAARFLALFDRLRPDLLTARYSLLSPVYRAGEADVFAFARTAGAGVLLKQVLAQGLLTGSHHPDRPRIFGHGDHRAGKPWFAAPALRVIHDALVPLRRHFGADPQALASAALRYVLHTAPDAVALVGLHTPDQARAATAVTPPLTQEELALLSDTGQHIRRRLDDIQAHTTSSKTQRRKAYP